MESSAILSSNSLFPIPAEQHSLLPRRAPFGEHLQQPLQAMATTGCGKKEKQVMNLVRISEPGRRFFKDLMEEEEEEEDKEEERSMRQVFESLPQQLLQQQHPSAASSNRHKEKEEEEETSIWSDGENRTIVGTIDGLRGFEERGPQTRGPGPRIEGPDEVSLSRHLQLIQSLRYDECFWGKKEKEREKDEKGEKEKEGTRELKTLEDISCLSHVSRKSFVRERPSTGQLFLGGSGGGVLHSTFNYPLHSTPKEAPTLLPLNSPPASRDDHVAWSGDLDPQTTEWRRRRRRRMERGEGEDDRQLGTGYFSIGISDHCRPENYFTRRPSEDHLIRRPSEDQRLVDRLLYRKRHDDVMADKENW